MSKYRIGEPDLNGKVWIEDQENGKVFNGYSFMGCVIWEDYGGDAYWAEPEEAEQIVADLEAADENPSNLATYEVEVLNEYGHIIHYHSYQGSREEAEDNARKSCKFHHGTEWKVLKIRNY